MLLAHVGAKSAQSQKSAGRQRLWLSLFGALFVVLFLVFAVTQGIGQPSVPAGNVALVEDVADGDVSEADLKRAVDRQVSQQVDSGELQEAPKPGSDAYEELQDAALTQLIEEIWLRGEAEELDISVTKKQVENELDQIKEQSFPTPKAYKEFLETSNYTQEEVDELVELQVVNRQIQERITTEALQPSNTEIADYYEAAKATQFTTGPTRDVRIVANENKGQVEKALKELEADNSPATWEKVAKKYSNDPATQENGGLQEGVVEEILPEPLKAEVFQAATGELLGPIEIQGNFGIVEVVKLNPEKVQSLGEVRSQISNQLSEQAQQAFFTEFAANYQSKWTSRTFCASGFAVDRCANFTGDGRPANAPPGCYEENPKEGEALECPAPVAQVAPAVPGSVTILQPQGERLPQRPLPEASGEGEGAEGLDGQALEELEGAVEEGGAGGAEAAPEGATGE